MDESDKSGREVVKFKSKIDESMLDAAICIGKVNPTQTEFLQLILCLNS